MSVEQLDARYCFVESNARAHACGEQMPYWNQGINYDERGVALGSVLVALSHVLSFESQRKPRHAVVLVKHRCDAPILVQHSPERAVWASQDNVVQLAKS